MTYVEEENGRRASSRPRVDGRWRLQERFLLLFSVEGKEENRNIRPCILFARENKSLAISTWGGKCNKATKEKKPERMSLSKDKTDIEDSFRHALRERVGTVKKWEKLGTGGNSTVYTPVLNEEEEKRAYKMGNQYFRTDPVAKKERVRRFGCEAQWGFDLENSKIDLTPPVCESWTTNWEEETNVTCIVMEYLENYQTLDTLVSGPGSALSQNESAQLLGDLVTKMMKTMDQTLHSYFIHRDIKPDNVMVRLGADDKGKKHCVDVKLLDWGLAYHPKIYLNLEKRKEKEEEEEEEEISIENLSIYDDSEKESKSQPEEAAQAKSEPPQQTQPDEVPLNAFLRVSEAGDKREDVMRSPKMDIKLLGALYFYLRTGKRPFDVLHNPYPGAHVTDQRFLQRLMDAGEWNTKDSTTELSSEELKYLKNWMDERLAKHISDFADALFNLRGQPPSKTEIELMNHCSVHYEDYMKHIQILAADRSPILKLIRGKNLKTRDGLAPILAAAISDLTDKQWRMDGYDRKQVVTNETLQHHNQEFEWTTRFHCQNAKSCHIQAIFSGEKGKKEKEGKRLVLELRVVENASCKPILRQGAIDLDHVTQETISDWVNAKASRIIDRLNKALDRAVPNEP
mmetsp:Transcript_40497/g.105001  ORF Transcript_40497/g.105001 Transcript_40497/m.105001 type:complete len:628 (-) Transcript_40497:2596-4479(-)